MPEKILENTRYRTSKISPEQVQKLETPFNPEENEEQILAEGVSYYILCNSL